MTAKTSSMNLSRKIALPIALLGLLALYLTWEVDESYSWYIIPCVLLLALIYVFSPQIDWWGYKKRPPKLDPLVESLIGKHLPFYQKLSPADRQKFRNRVALYSIAKEYMPQGFETVPADIKGLIASCAVWISFGKEDFLFKKFENIILYPHPFPSPQYPEHFHVSEIFEEDGVIMFAMEHFMVSYTKPAQYYHTGLHEYARVFLRTYPNENYPAVTADFWEKIARVSGFSKAAVEKWIGLPELENLPVLIVHFFAFPDRFRQFFPSEYTRLKEIFNLEP